MALITPSLASHLRPILNQRGSLVRLASSSFKAEASSRRFSSLIRSNIPHGPTPTSLLATRSSRGLSLFPSSSPTPPQSFDVDNSLRAASASTTPSTPPPSVSESIASGIPNRPSFEPAQIVSPIETTSAVGVQDSPNGLIDLAHIPMEIGDLKAMGLASWWPTGRAEAALEALHVWTGLPWWATIILTTFILRALLFRIFLNNSRTQAKMLEIQPEMQQIQERLKEAKAQKDNTKASIEGQNIMKLYRENKVNPLTMIGGVLLTIPTFIAMFLALKKMAALPVPQLLVGGIPGWCQDLTQIDPTYILPATSAAATWLLAHYGANGAKPSTQADSAIALSFGMKTAAIMSFPIVSGITLPASIPLIGGFGASGFPAAVLLYWTTSNGLSFLQSYLIQIPVVRRYFELSPVPTFTRPPGQVAPGGWQAVKNYFANSTKEAWAKAQAQEEAQLERQRKAGVQARQRVLDIERLGKKTKSEGSVLETVAEAIPVSHPAQPLPSAPGSGSTTPSSAPAPVPVSPSARVQAAPISEPRAKPKPNLTPRPTMATATKSPSPVRTSSKFDTLPDLQKQRIALAERVAAMEAKVVAAAQAAKAAKAAKAAAARDARR